MLAGTDHVLAGTPSVFAKTESTLATAQATYSRAGSYFMEASASLARTPGFRARPTPAHRLLHWTGRFLAITPMTSAAPGNSLAGNQPRPGGPQTRGGTTSHTNHTRELPQAGSPFRVRRVCRGYCLGGDIYERRADSYPLRSRREERDATSQSSRVALINLVGTRSTVSHSSAKRLGRSGSRPCLVCG